MSVSQESVVLAHREDGDPAAPPVLMAPSLGTTWEMWDPVVASLSSTYRVVRFDTRGHGRSPVPPRPYTMEAMAEDVVALADRLGIDRFCFVGLSLGGCIGQMLGLKHPDRLSALVLCCTLPRFGDSSSWQQRAAAIRAEGMGVLAERTRGRWFTEAFRSSHPDAVERCIGMLTATPVEGYAGCCDALASFDATDDLGRIDVPTRVLVGAEDPVATVELGERMVAALPDAELTVIERASHIACIEQPGVFTHAVTEHLGRHLP